MHPDRPVETIESSEALEGNLEKRALAEVLLGMARPERTGILTIQGRDDIIAISFLEGEVVAADALNKTVEEGLRDVLLRQDVLDAGEFMALNSEHQAGGGRVIDLLVERNYLDRDQLLEALREQVYRVLANVLRWSEADYRFYSGDEVFYEEGLLPLSVAEILIRTSRELGEDAPLASPIPDLAAVFRRVKEADTELHTLSERERDLLDFIDGSSPCSHVMMATSLPEFELLLMVHSLQEKGVIERRATAFLPQEDEFEEPPDRVAPLGAIAADSKPAGVDVDLPLGSRPTIEASAPLAPAVPEAAAEPRSLKWRDRWILLWANRVISALALVAFGGSLIVDPASVVYPAPWDLVDRQKVVEEVRESQYSRLDLAARTFFLVEGRFAHNLEAMVELGLISDGDLEDPTGHRLALSGGESTYLLQILDDLGAAVTVKAEGINGDLLLDPLYGISTTFESRPLVLLD